MFGIIGKYAFQTMTLMQRSSISDGKPVWTSSYCCGIMLDFSKDDTSRFGAIQNGKIFLVAPLASQPQLPAKITYDSKDYDIKAIKVYRNLRGEICGYRMAAAGA